MNLLTRLRCNEIGFNLVISQLFTLMLNAVFILHAREAIPYSSAHNYLFALTIPLVLFCAFLIIFNLVALAAQAAGDLAGARQRGS